MKRSISRKAIAHEKVARATDAHGAAARAGKYEAELEQALALALDEFELGGSHERELKSRPRCTAPKPTRSDRV